MAHTSWYGQLPRVVSGIALCAGASLLIGAPGAALAAPVDGDTPSSTPLPGPPGDNGTVKVHHADTDEEARRNEPHVCAFYLVGFGFDAAQEVAWEIKPHPSEGGGDPREQDPVLDGELTLDEEGHGRTEELSLDDGRYKLYWSFDGSADADGKGPKGPGTKHKVLHVDCGEDGDEGGGDSPEPSEPPESEEPTPGESESPTDEPTAPEETGAPAPDPSESGVPEDGETTAPPEEEDGAAPAEADEGNLPVTGTALTGIIVAAVLAIGGGVAALLLARKRKADTAGADEAGGES